MIDKTVLVVGCGGLGGYVVEELARLGIKRLVLFDGDDFCESNMNRQLESGLDTLGKKKALVYKERLERKFGIFANAHDEFLTEDNTDILSSVDLVFDCVDTVGSRLMLENLCEKYQKILVHGGVEGCYGQACVCLPGEKTLSKLYAQVAEQKHSTNVYTVSTVASMQVALAQKVFAEGIDEVKNRLFLLDMGDLSIQKIRL